MGNDAATEILEPRECWELLRGVSVGRLAVWLGDRPDIFPVNYALDGTTQVLP